MMTLDGITIPPDIDLFKSAQKMQLSDAIIMNFICLDVIFVVWMFWVLATQNEYLNISANNLRKMGRQSYF